MSLESPGQLRGDGEVGFGGNGARLLEHDRTSFVPAGHDLGVERNRTEERNAELTAHALAAAVTEDVRGFAAVRAREGAHVLDDAEDGDVHRLEHPQAAAGDLEAHVLRRRHDDRAG